MNEYDFENRMTYQEMLAESADYVGEVFEDDSELFTEDEEDAQ